MSEILFKFFVLSYIILATGILYATFVYDFEAGGWGKLKHDAFWVNLLKMHGALFLAVASCLLLVEYTGVAILFVILCLAVALSMLAAKHIYPEE